MSTIKQKMLTIAIDKLIGNEANPRYIKEKKFELLVKSLEGFPEMLAIRPIVIDEDFVVLGGNMRLKAAEHIGYKELTVSQWTGLTELQKKEFIIKDNASFGDWNYDTLADEWNAEELNDWGLDVWAPDEDADYDILNDDDDDTIDAMASNVRRALLIPFDAEHYDTAFDLVKHFREVLRRDVGAILVKHLEELKYIEDKKNS